MSKLLRAKTGSRELPVEIENIDSCISTQQQHQSKQVASTSLKRYNSTPARIKDGYIISDQLEDGRNSPSSLASLQTKLAMTRYHQHRLSDSAANTSHAKHTTCSSPHTQTQVSNCQPSTTTSSSSSASDSAFSRSQTTLKSTESVSYSRGSLKESFLRRDKKNRKVEVEKSSSEDPDHKFNTSKYDKNHHFEIVWKNLSFKVPEKRFSQISSKLNKFKDVVCSSKENQEEVTERVADDSSNISSSSTQDPDELRSPTVGKQRPVIFENLNGHARSGELTAILGPSGAGKTTFLKCLTNSHVKGATGSIEIKGGIGASQRLKLCIIPQKDYLFDYLTVMENLTFASRIKNTQKNFNHKQNVDRVANLLGLQSCLNLKTKKLSGGQYKRVSIAQELLSNPDILVLDEPTSGLDSLTCFRTVNVLRDLVDMSQKGIISPLAIIMTIHQPQIKIFNSFHHVYILSSLGQCVYEGKPENLVDTVAECCKLLPPPDDLNPATFIIDLASEVFGPEPIKELNDLQQRNSITYEAHQQQTKIKEDQNKQDCSNIIFQVVPLDGEGKQNRNINLEQGQCNQEELMICERLKRRYSHKGNFWLHTNLLIKRLWISSWRDPLLTTTRVMFHLIIPFVFYFIYSQKSGIANACPYVEREFDFQTMTSDANIDRLKVQHNELILTFENVSLFFLLLYSFSMCVLAVTALSFPLNMQILLKETGNGWYSMSRFVMAKTLADLPLELAMPMVSVAIAYVLTGQPSSYLCWRMLTVTAVMTICSLISQTQGLLFGAYFMNNVQAAVFISQASSLPWIMLSGFTTRISELPTILQWLSFGSIYRLGIESIVAVRYGFGICPCDTEIVNSTPPKLVGIPDQIKSVISYYMDVYKEPTGVVASATTNSNSTVDVFEKIASTLSRANTYGVDIVNCHDVRPFILSAREVDEGTLPMFLTILVSIFIGLKIMLFCVVKLRAA